MTTENIDIKIREDGSRVVVRNINEIGGASDKAANSVDFLKKALGALTAVLAIDKIRQYADAWSSAAALISIATKSSEEQIAVQERLFQVAQKTRTGYTDIVELYGRAARAGKELGASQEQIIKFTDGVGKSLAIQHTSTTQAAGALLQLGQALGSGKIQAQEYNSLLDGAPVLLQVVAKNFKGTGGSVAALTKLVKDGKVTSKEFFDAFLAGADSLQADFDKSSKTIGGSIIVVTNAFTKYIGELDHAVGLSNIINKAAVFLAENMKQLATVLLAVGAAVAVAFAPGLVAAFAASVARLFLLLNANPFIALASAAAALAVYFSQLGDEILLGSDSITTINDVFRAFVAVFKEELPALKELTIEVFSGIADFASAAFKAVDTEGAVDKWKEDISGFYDGLGAGFQGVVRAIAKTFDAIGGLLIGLANAVVTTFNGLPGAASIPFRLLYNVAVSYIEAIINTVIDGINKVRGFVGAGLLETVKLDRVNVNEAFFTQYGAAIVDSIDNGFKAQGGALLKSVDSLFDRAQEIAKKRTDAIVVKPTVDLTTPLGKAGKVDNSKEIEKATNALRSLLNTILPSTGAIYELAKAQKVLNDAQKVGLISGTQNAAYYELARKHYEDIINPLGKVNRELDEQTKLLSFNSKERAVQSQLLQIQKDLESQGLPLTQAQTQALRERLVVQQQLNELVSAQDGLLEESVGKREQFVTQLVAIQNLLSDPTSGFTQGDANAAILAQNQDLLANTQIAIDAQVQAYTSMYERIDILRQKGLISEQTAAQARMKVDIEYAQFRIKSTQDIFANLATLSTSGNSKLAAIGKAAAITTATIDGVVAVQKAYAAPPGWPYNAASVISVGVAAAANVAKLAGFESGGYTGSGGTSQVAGLVHGQEFVVNADATSRNRAALEDLNRGRDLNGGGGGNVVSIVINNTAEGTRATAQERDTPGGKEITVMVETIVVNQIRNGGPIADAAESQYNLNRAAGSVR